MSEVELRHNKKSEYKIYKQLKLQELNNPKNKFDNRLYFSMRYKILNYNTKVEDELFKTNYNRELWKVAYQRNSYWYRRADMLQKYMIYGSNKNGMKKMYKLERFLEYPKNIGFGALIFIGFNLAYLGLALHYKKLEHDIWIHQYGDFFPRYEKVGVYTFRTLFRKIRYYLHAWKIVDGYRFSKYDIQTVQFPTGYANEFILEHICREKEYKRKRDDTFDFMQLGENDYHEYKDGLF